jgi:hypothetical protein
MTIAQAIHDAMVDASEATRTVLLTLLEHFKECPCGKEVDAESE